MSINCSKCKHDNPDDSKYCNNCGEDLGDDKHPADKTYVAFNEKDLSAQAYVDEFKKSMQAYAEIARNRELDKFQSQATTWAKYQFAGMITAVTALAAFLGFIGFKGINLEETIDTAKERLEISVAEAQKQISEGSTDIASIRAESQQQVDDLLANIENKTSLLESINEQTIKNKENLKTHIASLKALKKDLNDQLTKVSKMERSRYKIQVHYNIAQIEETNQKAISDLQSALLDKGYIVGSDNIMSVSTDKQQVIYYSNSQEIINNAKEIQSALKERFGNIDIKLEKSDRKTPFEIVVKLCQKLKSDNYTCDNSL